MFPLQFTDWGALTALGDTHAGFERLCAGATGLVAAAEAGIPWLDVAGGRDLFGPIGQVPGSPAQLLDRLLAPVAVDGRGLGVVLATTGGATPDGEVEVGHHVRGEPLGAPRDLWWGNLPHHLAEGVARRFGADGPVLVVSTACTSGTVAVGVGADLLRAGRAARVLVVGVDAVCRSSLFGFRSLGVYAGDRCRPFDTGRAGMNVGAGAAWVLLEARGPGARFELLGVGVAQDAAHLTAPDPAGRGLGRAIAEALGGVSPTEVDHVNAHGTATIPNDATEAAVLPRLLPHAAVSATKGATGHTLGAAGLIELVFLLQSMEAGVVPPVVGLHDPLPGVDVAGQPRVRRQRVGVSVNLAFGGHNAAVAVRRVEGPGGGGSGGPRSHSLTVPRIGGTGVVRAFSTWTVGGRDADPRHLATHPPGTPFTLLAAPDPMRPDTVSPGNWRRMSRLARLALTAVAPLPVTELADASAVFGLLGGEFTSGVAFLRSYFKSPALSSPLAFQNTVHNAPAAHVSIETGLLGPSETLLAGTRTAWRALERALARVSQTGRPVLLVVADEATPDVRDGALAAGAAGVWGEAAAAVLLTSDGPGVRFAWREGPAPVGAWGRAQPWLDLPGGGAPAFGWDAAFGLGAGAELAALLSCLAVGGLFAGPDAWVEVT